MGNDKSNTSNISSKERKQLEAKHRQKTQPLRKQIQKIEKLMQQTTEKINAINEELSDGDIYTDGNKQKLQALLLERAEHEKTHDKAEDDWLNISEELEQISS